ncbi:MAG: hypothetical protein ABII00_09450 [Elusimicrobiota bacterium]
MSKRKLNEKDQTVSVTLDPGAIHPDAVLGAAQVLTRKAEVWVRKNGLTLRPKKRSSRRALEALAEEFSEEAIAQELRRRIAADNRSVREFIITQALLAAAGERGERPDPARSAGPSGNEQNEIQELIREAEWELNVGSGKDEVEGRGGAVDLNERLKVLDELGIGDPEAPDR